MSLRAIKKRESTQLTPATGLRATLFKKSPPLRKFSQLAGGSHLGSSNSNSSSANASATTSTVIATNTLSPLHCGRATRALLGRRWHSNPDLCRSAHTVEWLEKTCLVRTKSESDVSALLASCRVNAADTAGRGLIGAKSEVCLQTISSHNCYQQPTGGRTESSNTAPQCTSPSGTMISGARSHRDLSQSAYATSGYDGAVSPTRRRMSECSMNSSSVGYSQRTSAMSSSVLTLASTAAPIDPNTVLRVPIIGYEVMEERARFTVYKLRVENPHTNDCWLVLRRYTDFVRLNTKLKQAYPFITLMLPRKKIFGDNFNSVFLDNRVQGLQMFVNSVMANEELRKCKMVREFFCLDEPPTYSESMEECRAIFEAQEETIAHLKMQVSSKNDLILSLQQKLRDEFHEKERLKESLKNMSTSCARCSSANGTVN